MLHARAKGVYSLGDSFYLFIVLSPITKRNLFRIIPFSLFWLVFSTIYILMEGGLIGTLDVYPSTGNPYSFISNILITPVTAFIAGTFIGAIEVFYLSKVFAQRRLVEKILYKTLLYVLSIIVFLLGVSVIGNSFDLHQSVFNPQIWNKAWLFFSNYGFWSIAIYIASIIVVSLFYHEVSDNLGQGVLVNFLTGKYHTPIEEERIFMFLDMKSSTTIAEKLGHVRYFEMLREYYADLSDPIINYSGEIYQYVGDEVVVSWTLQNGLHHNNCIRCFFAMKEALQQQEKKYNDRFGVLPQFKAGFHAGKVTTGEIGIIKKEIIFTGDVLNTTARIQSLCNTYTTDLLLSGYLLEQLSLDNTQVKALGECELRGRGEKVQLFTYN